MEDLSKSTSAPAVPDFVAKLYRMLEDGSHAHIVSWSPNGDSFIIHDPSDFAKKVLPRHFRHGNFASFVRQLNKYDFHKVKKKPERPSFSQNKLDLGDVAEQAWEFKHPHFVLNHKELLCYIKRKAPTKAPGPRNSQNDEYEFKGQVSPTGNATSLQLQHPANIAALTSLQPTTAFESQIQAHFLMVVNDQREMNLSLDHVVQQCHTLKHELDLCRQEIRQRDEMLHQAAERIAYLERGLSNGNYSTTMTTNTGSGSLMLPPLHGGSTPFMGTFSVPGPTSPNGMGFSNGTPNGLMAASQPSTQFNGSMEWMHVSSPAAIPAMNIPTSTPLDPFSRESSTGMTITTTSTVGSTLPSHAPDRLRGGAQRFASSKIRNDGDGTVNASSGSIWKQPPRVLLVEDDAVCLGLSARLLKLFGCELDVATDGFSAVAKLSQATHRYDLVLMDVGLPGLDGVQAASKIRSFDNSTPIVTMTGHTTARECLTYLSTGMNDILAKPFRKETLWEMLEKHCRHLERDDMRQVNELADQTKQATVGDPMLMSMEEPVQQDETDDEEDIDNSDERGWGSTAMPHQAQASELGEIDSLTISGFKRSRKE